MDKSDGSEMLQGVATLH